VWGAASEAETGSRNRGLAWFMKSFGMLSNEVETVPSAYCRQCAVSKNMFLSSSLTLLSMYWMMEIQSGGAILLS
jgi:glutaminase